MATYPGFEDILRRIITGEDADGTSVIVIDGPPADAAVAVGRGGLLEIWRESVIDALDPAETIDRGTGPAVLSPPANGVEVRWFVIEPSPEDVPREVLNKAARAAFAGFGGEQHIHDQSRHPAMHKTESLDIICLVKGDASLILDDSEVRLTPGQVVIQRGTHHAWTAHGGPAIFLAVLIDRTLKP